MVQGRDRTQWFCQDLHAKVLQSAVEPWQKQTHASTAARDHARATAIKPALVPSHLPRCIPCPTPNSPELAHSSGDLSATRQSRPKTTTVAEPFPALLRSIQAPR
jgi:hypothetical protein